MNFLPRRCRTYLTSKSIQFREIVDNGTCALIIDNYQLPTSKFDHERVRLLLFFPDGYPDSAPDMFYLHPWIKVSGSSVWPTNADQAQSFEDVSWQRWSRHWTDWRAGIDGIQTWLIKIRTALVNA